MNLSSTHTDFNSNNFSQSIILPNLINKGIYENSYDFCNKLELSYDELIILQKQLTFLQSNNQYVSEYVFSDFDDTLFTRKFQITQSKFERNRGIDGNEIVKQMGLNNYINEFYTPDLLVTSISDFVNTILTAGEVELQNAKIQKVGLFEKDTIVVSKHSDKPKALLYFILFQLKKIPQNIQIYDDRIKELKPHLNFISEFLGNNIISHDVTLDSNEPNQIGLLKTNIYRNGEELRMN